MLSCAVLWMSYQPSEVEDRIIRERSRALEIIDAAKPDIARG